MMSVKGELQTLTQTITVALGFADLLSKHIAWAAGSYTLNTRTAMLKQSHIAHAEG